MPEGRSTSAPVLATHGLSRHFGGLVAVHDVSISLRQGELHAVIGPNGAGKTTLVNMLSGEIKPTAGRVELDGREVAGEPAWRMTRLGIGRSFQRTNIFLSLSVLENVRLAAQAMGVPQPCGRTSAALAGGGSLRAGFRDRRGKLIPLKPLGSTSTTNRMTSPSTSSLRSVRS